MSSDLTRERHRIKAVYAALGIDPPPELATIWAEIDALTTEPADGPSLEEVAAEVEQTGEVDHDAVDAVASAEVLRSARWKVAQRLALSLDRRAQAVHQADWSRAVAEVRPRWDEAAATVHELAPRFAGRERGPAGGGRWSTDDARAFADLQDATAVLDEVTMAFRSWDTDLAKSGVPFVAVATDDDLAALKSRFTVSYNRRPEFWIELVVNDFPSARLRLADDPRQEIAEARDRRRQRQERARLGMAHQGIDENFSQSISSDPAGATRARKKAVAERKAREKAGAAS